MPTLQAIHIKRVLEGLEGYFISAEHQEFNQEYYFIIDSGGRVHGRTNSNQWVELSRESRGIIRDKVKEFFCGNN